MLFDSTIYNDPNKPDPNRQLLRDYSTFKTKFDNAVSTEKKARPWWTAISGITSSFIPFGLGAFITPAATMGVDKGKAVGTEKLNHYRSLLGLPQEADKSGSGLNLGGAGYAAGSQFSTGLGRDVIPSEDGQVHQLNLSGLGSTLNTANFMSGANVPTTQPTYTHIMDGNNQLPNAPELTGGGTTGLNLPQTDYWNPSGGGANGLLSTTQNGYSQAPQVLRNGGKISGGKINAPSHEEGGAELIDNETKEKKGIEVEGNERIVNDNDWTSILALLHKGKNKKALSLLKDIDKRKPVEGKAEEGINLGNAGSGYYDFNNPNTTTDYVPQPIQDNVLPANALPVAPVSTSGITPRVNPLLNTTKVDWNNALNYGLDAGKLGLGLNSAMSPLPKYEIPKDWHTYMDKARYFSEQGLLPEEKAAALDLGNQAYAAQVRDLTNMSGGNAGALLGDLGNVGLGRYRIANQLALADAQRRQENFDKFGTKLERDIAMKKDVFDRQYNQALANKTEGMGLASDALANIKGRMDFNKSYGDGSYYDKLQKALVAKGESEADIAKKMAEYAASPAFALAAHNYSLNPSNYTDAKILEDADKIASEANKSALTLIAPPKQKTK